MFNKTVYEIVNEFEHLIVENFYPVEIVFDQSMFEQIKKYPFFVLEDGVNIDLLFAVDEESHRIFVVSGELFDIDPENKVNIDELSVHKTPLKEYNLERLNNKYFACVRVDGKKTVVNSHGKVIWKEE